MEDKDYVSYDVAKAMRSKTKHYFATRYFYLNGVFVDISDETPKRTDEVIQAPSLYEAQQWLIEEQGISVEPSCTERGWMWQVCRCDAGHGGYILGYNIWTPCAEGMESYQAALNAGIREALQYL